MCDACAAQVKLDNQKKAVEEEESRKQKYKDALVDTRSEFLKTVGQGIIVGLVWCLVMRNYGNNTFGDLVGQFVLMIFVPFGWKILTYLQSFIPLTIFGTWWFWLIYAFVKLFLSIFIGIPAFFYQPVKTIHNQKKLQRLE